MKEQNERTNRRSGPLSDRERGVLQTRLVVAESQARSERIIQTRRYDKIIAERVLSKRNPGECTCYDDAQRTKSKDAVERDKLIPRFAEVKSCLSREKRYCLNI